MSDTADVVVIGGGVIGCATAFELSRRGAKVTLVERAELAAGASGRNHGLLLSPLDPVMAPLARLTARSYEEIEDELPIPIRLDPEPIGFMVLAGDDEAEAAAATAEAKAAESCGVDVEPLDGDAARRLEPEVADDIRGGWHLHDGRRLDPAALTVSLALLARGAGARVRTHVAARALTRSGDRVTGVVTDEGTIGADAVVVAAGPWSGSLLRPVGIHLPIQGARGWLVHLRPNRLPPISRLVGRAGWHAPPDPEPLPPMTARDVSEDRMRSTIGTLLQPNPDGTLLVGGSREATLAAEPHDPSVPKHLVEEAIRLVPAVAEANVLGAWWGVRPTTPDSRPYVGFLREGLFVATGHGSIGVILGGGTGRLIASMVVGEEPPVDARPFDPARATER